MLPTLLRRFFSSEADTMRGVHIVVYCHRLFQDDYYDAAKVLEESGLKGTVRVLDGGPVELKLEGNHKTLEGLLRSIDTGSLFKTQARKTFSWIPFRHQ